MSQMNERTRQKVIEIAKPSGFLVQTKTDGSDLYVKNMVFRHGGVGQTVYVRKERGMDSLGNAKKYTLAIHPDYFRPEFSNPSRGFVRSLNNRKGGHIFYSSNYQAFPVCPDSPLHCGCHIEVDNDTALAELFKLLAGNASVTSASRPPVAAAVRSVDEELPRFDDPLPEIRASRATQPGDLSGLVIRREPLQQILRGEKTWEMRASQVHKRGLIALIEKGTGLVVGVANLVGCKGPLSNDEMVANQDKHLIEPARLSSSEVAKWRTAWILEDVLRLPRPVPYQHPSGAVTWVTLDLDVVEGVRAQIAR